MKSGDAIPRFPELNAIREDLNRLKWMWLFCCVSPIIYLLLASYIARTFFNPPEERGLMSMSATQYYAVIGFGAFVAIVLQFIVLYVRKRYDGHMRRNVRHISTVFRLYTKRTFLLMALSECVTLLGFLLFLAQGQLEVLFGFGAAGLIFYAQSYPSETGLGTLTKEL